jgi:hypothetical protein
MRAFTLSDGGPLRRLLHRVPARWILLAVWLPLFVDGISPIVRDLSVHARLLVGVPAVLLAEKLVSRACGSAVASLYNGGIAAPGALDRIVDRGGELRDAWWPELALAALAIVDGQLALWGVTETTRPFHAEVHPMSLERVWYLSVAFPLARFVTLRFLWRWAVWSMMLARIAGLRLSLLATHPDHACGISCLARPVSGFGAFAFAVGVVLASAWGTQMLAGTTTLREQLPELLVFLFVVLVLAVAPLLPLCSHLYRVRRRGLADYGDFSFGYMRGFHDKWIETHVGGERALGTQDIQSLADIGNAFSVVLRTRLFAFSMRHVLAVLGSALLPMVPLYASTTSVEKVLAKVFGAVLGGLPL